LEDGEFDRLEEAAKQTKNAHIWPIIVFAIETGMRRGEILGLHWEHVELDRCIAFLPLTKNGSSREVPLSTKAIKVLVAQRQRNDTPSPSLLRLTASGWRGIGSGAVLACLTFVSMTYAMRLSHAYLSLG
jgi:integrase